MARVGGSRAGRANAFAGNQLSQFKPRQSSAYGIAAHVFFDAHSRANILVGDSGSVLDLGQDNSITGSHQQGQERGPTLSAALAAKRALVRTVRP